MKKHIQINNQSIMEIFWDQPEMTPARLEDILNNPDLPEYYPVLGRMVERLSVPEITSLVDREILYSQFPKLKVWKRMSAAKAKELFPDKYSVS